jgi:hypothetical protein
MSASGFDSDSVKGFRYIDGFVAYLKGKNISVSDKMLEKYISEFHSDLNKNNEFEWKEGVVRYRNEINQLVADFDYNTMFVFERRLELGDYDFNRLGFPLSIKDGTYWPLEPTI